MLKIFKCRRSSLGLIGMVLIAALGVHLKIDTSGAIALVCLSVAAANASEGMAAKIKAQKSSSDSDAS